MHKFKLGSHNLTARHCPTQHRIYLLHAQQEWGGGRGSDGKGLGALSISPVQQEALSYLTGSEDTDDEAADSLP